jgi:hypothetical protein
MVGVTFSSTGDFRNTERFLQAVQKIDISGILNSCGQEGVNALASATPIETGLAAHSWAYRVSSSGGNYTIEWYNADVENGFNVILALQYGHGTGTGGWVPGRDFINPAIRPVFDRIAERVWKAVTSA